MYDEKHNKYAQKYIKDNYDQLSLRLKKTEEPTRETIRKAAELAGETVNTYVINAVKMRMDHEHSQVMQKR